MKIVKKIVKIISSLVLMLSVISVTSIQTTQVYADYNSAISIILNSDGLPLDNQSQDGWSYSYDQEKSIGTLTLTSGDFVIGYDKSSMEVTTICKAQVIVESGASIYNGSFTKSVTNSGIIYGGTYTGEVINNGTISNYTDFNQNPQSGTFSGAVTNNGTISDGSFQANLTNSATGLILGGTFNSSCTITNVAGGAIRSGTFNGTINNYGQMGQDEQHYNPSYIIVSNGPVINYAGGTIAGGTYNAAVTNNESAIIYTGTFTGSVSSNGAVWNGDFTNNISGSGSGTVAVWYYDTPTYDSCSPVFITLGSTADLTKMPSGTYDGYEYNGHWYSSQTINDDNLFAADTKIYKPTKLYSGWNQLKVNQITVGVEGVTGDIHVKVGEKQTFTATVLPSNAGNKKVTWTVTGAKAYSYISVTSDNSKATLSVSSEEDADVLTVTAKSVDDTSVSGSVTVHVDKKEHTADLDKFQDESIPLDRGEATKTISLTDNTWADISYTSLNEDIATCDNAGNIKFHKEGVATIQATVVAKLGYKETTFTCKLTITLQTPTFDYLIPVDMTAGNEPSYPAPLSRSEDDDGKITYSCDSSFKDIATIDSETGLVTPVGGGYAIIVAHIEKTTKYDEAYAQVTIHVIGLIPNLNDDNFKGGDYNFGTTGQSLKLTSDSEGAVTYKSSNENIVYIDDSGNMTFNGVGDGVTITASIARSGKYDAISSTCTVNVKKGTPEVDASSFNDISKTFGNADFTQTVTVTANSKLPGAQYSCSDTDKKVAVVDAASGTVTIKGAGECDITATVGNNDYFNLFTKTYHLTVNKAPSTITIQDNTGKVYDGSNLTVGTAGADVIYSYDGDGLVSSTWYEDNGGSRGSVLSSAPVNAGTYWIGISADEGSNYAAAAEVYKQFEIRTVTATIMVDDILAHQYIGQQIAITDPVVKVNGTAIDHSNYQVTNGSNLNVGTNVGSVTIEAAPNGNYSFTSVTKYFDITPADLTITAAATTKYYGQKDPKLNYSASGLAGNDTDSVITGSLKRAEGEAKGTYAISQGSVSAGSNYNIIYVGADFTIDASDVSLSIHADHQQVKAGKTITFTINASNGSSDLMAEGWSDPTGVTLTGSNNTTISLTADGTAYTGTYTIPAGTAPGTEFIFTASVNDTTMNYNHPADQPITVSAAPLTDAKLTLRAGNTSDVIYGDSVTYFATTSNELEILSEISGTISFYLGEAVPANLIETKDAAGNPSITIDRTSLTAGTHTITAVYSGNTNFASSSKQVTTTVAPKGLTWVTSGLSSSKTYDGTTDAEIIGDLNVAGGLEGDTLGFTYNAANSTAVYGNKNAGTETVIMTVSNPSITNTNYALPTASPTYSGTILQASIDSASLSVSQYNYTGSAMVPSIGEVKSGTMILTASDYDLSGDSSKTDAGTYQVTVTGKGNFTGSKTLEWKINPIAGSVSVSTASWTYGDSASTPAVTINTGDYKNPTYQYKKSGDPASYYSTTVPTKAGYTYNIRVSYEATNNYTAVSAVSSFTISKKALTLTIAGTTTKVYDGTTSIKGLSIQTDGFVNGESFEITASSYNFTAIGVTTKGEIRATGISTTSYLVNNYSFPNEVDAYNCTILPRPVKVSGITASDKTYDGSTAAQLVTTGAVVDNTVQNEKIDVSAAGAFENANVGTGKTVNISGLQLSGYFAANYVLAEDGQQTTATASITAAELTVTADAKTKKYGQNDPALTFTAVDQLGNNVTDSIQGSLTRTAGESKGTYTITKGTLSGGDNYILDYHSADLTIDASDASLTITSSQASAKPGKTLTLTVTALNASDHLLTGGYDLPGGITLKAPDNSIINLTAVVGTAGQYTGTYVIPRETAAGTELKFTASVNDATGNYQNPADAETVVKVTQFSAANLSIVPSKTAGVVYGDSVTYTASAAAEFDPSMTLSGTLMFYLGDAATGTLLGTKTIGSDLLSVSLDHTKLTKGSHMITVVYSGDSEFDAAQQSYTTTVAPKELTWDTSKLAAEKDFDGTLETTLTGDLSVNGVADGDDAGFIYNKEETKGTFEDANAGEGKKVVVKVADGKAANENYILPVSVSPECKGTIHPVNEIPSPLEEEPHGYEMKLEMINSISSVPDEVKKTDTALQTLEDVKTKLKLAIEDILKADTQKEIVDLDLVLWVSSNNGVSWEKATTDNFPAGGLTVVIPFEQIGITYEDALHMNFAVTHMISTAMNGHLPGEVEAPAWTVTKAGLKFVLTGLSPVSIAYAAIPKISFDACGGTMSSTDLYTGNDHRIASLPSVSRDGYAFTGWYTEAEGGSQINENTVISTSMTVYAHWTKNNEDQNISSADNETVNTGDRYNLLLWMILEVIALIALCGAAVKRSQI